MSYASPAAVAAVSTRLAALPVPRCTEIANRVFMPGWDASPHGDHVRVTVLPEDDNADSDYCRRHLRTCERALTEVYDVRRVRDTITVIGGVAEADALEVRRS